jgi:flagellar motor switch protein FliN/FliY
VNEKDSREELAMSRREGEAPEGSGKAEGVPAPAEFGDVGTGGAPAGAGSIDMLMDVNLNVRIELGRTRMSVEDILKLQGGSVVTLDKLAGDFVDVLVNDKLVARGEVLILNDRFCVRVAEIVSPEARRTASQP